MYSVVLVAALASGSGFGGAGAGCAAGGCATGGGLVFNALWLTGHDIVYGQSVNYAPSQALFAQGGRISPEAWDAVMQGAGTGEVLGEGEAQMWNEYIDALDPAERPEVVAVWKQADAEGKRKLLAQVQAMREKRDKDAEKEKDKDKEPGKDKDKGGEKDKGKEKDKEKEKVKEKEKDKDDA